VFAVIVAAPPAATIGTSGCRDNRYGVPASPVAGSAYQFAFTGSKPAVRDSELQ
jgi:hypothetical protein